MFKDVHETKFVFYSYVSYVEVDRLLALKIFKGSNNHTLRMKNEEPTKLVQTSPLRSFAGKI